MSPKLIKSRPKSKPKALPLQRKVKWPGCLPLRWRKSGKIHGSRPKGPPAPQLGFGSFPTVQRDASGNLPVVWVWHSPESPDVEAWALLRSGYEAPFQVMGPADTPIDLGLCWIGVQAFRPPALPPGQAYIDQPWGDPDNHDDRKEFVRFIVNNWPHVGDASNLDLLLFDWRAGAALLPGTLGLFKPGLFRVREGGMADVPKAWALHASGWFSREIWMLWDPPYQYVAPGSSLPDASMWFEGVGGQLPGPHDPPVAWLEDWIRANEPHVGSSGVLVTHDVMISKPITVWP